MPRISNSLKQTVAPDDDNPFEEPRRALRGRVIGTASLALAIGAAVFALITVLL